MVRRGVSRVSRTDVGDDDPPPEYPVEEPRPLPAGLVPVEEGDDTPVARERSDLECRGHAADQCHDVREPGREDGRYVEAPPRS